MTFDKQEDMAVLYTNCVPLYISGRQSGSKKIPPKSATISHDSLKKKKKSEAAKKTQFEVDMLKIKMPPHDIFLLDT